MSFGKLARGVHAKTVEHLRSSRPEISLCALGGWSHSQVRDGTHGPSTHIRKPKRKREDRDDEQDVGSHSTTGNGDGATIGRTPAVTLAGDEEADDTPLSIVFCSNLEPPEHMWLTYKPDEENVPGNYGFVNDIAFIAEQCNVRLTLVHGDDVDLDLFPQDAVLLGHLRGPEHEKAVVVQCPRRKQGRMRTSGLEKRIDVFLRDHDTKLDTRLFDKINSSNSRDYGGNVVVTPPVDCAPDGKLIVGVGDSKSPSDGFLKFLRAEAAQPLVEIDTSWLKVGHADELVSFVATPKYDEHTPHGRRGWVMLMASHELAIELLKLAKPYERRWLRDGFSKELCFDNEYFSVTKFLERDKSEQIFDARLKDTEAKLMEALHLAPEDVVRVPAIFEKTRDGADACFPNMVNLQALGNCVIIPKPWGPLVEKAKIPEIFAKFNSKYEGSVDMESLVELLTTSSYWIPPTMTDEAFQAVLKLERAEIQPDWKVSNMTEYVDVIQRPDEEARETDSLQETTESAADDRFTDDRFTMLGDMWDEIPNRDSNGEEGEEERSLPLPPPSSPALEWRKVSVTSDCVDIFEFYMALMLMRVGVDVRFVDDWLYHKSFGDIHCGSQVRRQARIVPRKTSSEEVNT